VTAVEAPISALAHSAWVRYVRLFAAVALLWCGLHYQAGRVVMMPGVERAPVLLGYDGAATGATVTVLVTLAGAVAARWLLGPRDAWRTPIAVGVALAIWAASGGTMDHWLKFWNIDARPPTAGPYLALLPDYALVAGLLALIMAITRAPAWQPGRKGTAVAGQPSAATMSRAGAARAASWAAGPLAMLCAIGIAGTVMTFLSGPRTAATYTGQVYFAVAASMYLGVFAARRLTDVHSVAWYWPVPVAVGVLGVVWASLGPALPAPYDHINIIPSVGLVRALPVEMASVGLAAVVAAAHRSEEPARETAAGG
jgi:hypothetical protein